jgi:hypothetical protein
MDEITIHQNDLSSTTTISVTLMLDDDLSF